MRTILLSLCCILAASAVSAKTTGKDVVKETAMAAELEFSVDVMTYVEANVLATLYHEIGHALIDKMELPVFAREEDAADTFAVIVTEFLLSPEKAELVTWASADQYLQLNHQAKAFEPNYSGVHSLDLVRFFNTICLYYGGDVELRDDFAEENGLPERRAETCESERELAERSWLAVLKQIERTDDKSENYDWLVIDEMAESNNEYVIASHKVIEDAVAMFNQRFSTDFKIRVRMTNCNEDNAFYEAYGSKILMCNELIPPLSRRVDDL